MSFAIFADPYKDPNFQWGLKAVRGLVARGATVIVSHPMLCPDDLKGRVILDEPFLGTKLEDVAQAPLDYSLYRDCKAILSFGGDGTFLAVTHKAYRLDIPAVGVNLGSLGFMTEIEPEDLERALDQLVAADYFVRTRMMLEVRLMEGERLRGRYYALNDAVVSRGSGARILSVELSLSGRYIETMQCDGVIVSTPTGSTGYAMAAGGPIVDPSMDLLQITPICPHSLHSRAYIIPPNDWVTLNLDPGYTEQPPLSVDGRITAFIEPGKTAIEIRQAARSVKILELSSQDFFRELPEKLRGRSFVPRRED